MSTRFLVINDIHASDRSPLGRTENYSDEILAKLIEALQIAEKRHCDFIVLTGDIFHRFRGPQISYSLLVELLAIFRRSSIPKYAIAGNHDLSMAGIKSVFDMPFGLLALAGAFIWLEEPVVVDGMALLIPRNWGPSLDKLPSAFGLSKKEKELISGGGAQYAIMVAHASILPPGDSRPYPHHMVDELKLPGIDMVLSGHIHEGLGIHELPDLWFANVGSLARVSRTKEARERIPAVLEVELNRKSVNLIRHELTSARPADDVFLVKEVKEEREVSEFAAAITEGLELETVPLDELVAEHTKGLPEQVAAKLRYYLTEVES